MFQIIIIICLSGEAVNAIVKYHYRKEPQDGSLTALLCGEGGLVPSLEQIFLYGFKNQRIFGRNFYVWDYLGMPVKLLSIHVIFLLQMNYFFIRIFVFFFFFFFF